MSRKKASSKKKAIIIGIIAAVLALGIAGVILAVRNAGTPVEAAELTTDMLSVTVLTSGAVTSGESRDVYPETQGLIKSIAVKEGESVHAGDLLATLDNDVNHAQLSQAQSGLAQARSGLAQAQAAGSSASAGVAAAKASLTAAKNGLAAANNAQKSAQRLADLSKKVLNNAKAAVTAYESSGAAASDPAGYAQAKAAVTQAEIAYEQTKSGVNQAKAGAAQAKAGLAQAKAAVKQAEAAKPSSAITAANSGVQAASEGVSVAKKALDATVITAPIDGTVLFAPTPASAAAMATGAKPTSGAEPMKGAAVAPGSPVFTIINPQALSFTVEIDEADIPKIEVGQHATVTLDSFSEEEFAATVSRISTVAKSTITGGTVFEVELNFDADNEGIKLGMKGDGSIEIETKDATTAVPIEALFSEGTIDYLYLIAEDNTLEKTEVKVGATTDTSVEIIEGATTGAKVALAGLIQFSDGMRVKVQDKVK